jgi:hypothetical protein
VASLMFRPLEDVARDMGFILVEATTGLDDKRLIGS